MTREEKIQAIIALLQTDSNIIKLFKEQVTAGLPGMSDDWLDVILEILSE